MAEVEEWRVIEDYPAYEVSSFGRVRKDNLSISKSKYSIRLEKNGTQTTAYIHRLVAKAFLDAPKCGERIVKHKDEDKYNNHCTNLEWIATGSQSANMKKYSNEQVIAIQQDVLSGLTIKQIAKKYDLTILSVKYILSARFGKRCESLKREVAEYLKEQKLKSRYKIKGGTFIEWLIAFRQDILNGFSLTQLARKYKINESQALNIRLGKVCKEYAQLRDEVDLYVLQSRQARLQLSQRYNEICDEQEAIRERIAKIEITLEKPLQPTQSMFDGKPLEIIKHTTASGAIVSLPRVKFLEARA